MGMFVMAIPIAPGKTEKWTSFLSELEGPRRADLVASRKRIGVRERTFLQKTPMGDLVIVTLEGEDPAGAMQRFAASDDAFTKWFLEQVVEIHGVDLTKPPPGPPPELVIDTGS